MQLQQCPGIPSPIRAQLPCSPQVWLQPVGCCTSTPASGTSRATLWLHRDGKDLTGPLGTPNQPARLGAACGSWNRLPLHGWDCRQIFTTSSSSPPAPMCSGLCHLFPDCPKGGWGLPALPVCFVPWLGWQCLMVFSPTQVGTTVCQCLAALAAGGAGTGWAPGTLPVAQLLHMDGSTGVASPAAQCLVRGATALPKLTVCPWHRGARHVAPSEREYFPGSVFPSEGGWMLALLCSSELISLLESKCFPALAPAEELHCWAL